MSKFKINKSIDNIEDSLVSYEQQIADKDVELAQIKEANDELVANMRATKTIVALLREEVEELEMEIIELFKTVKARESEKAEM